MINPAGKPQDTRLDKRVNAEFRGKWVNSNNIDKTEAEIIAQGNAVHPDDLIES